MEEKRKGPFPARMIEYKGETVKLKALAKEHGINPRTLTTRLDRYGWSLDKSLTTPVKQLAKRKEKNLPAIKQYGTRRKIINSLMETFYSNPKRFEKWIKEQMDDDYEKFYKTYVMPFLPKDQNTNLDKTEKAIINIQFNAGKNETPIIIEGEEV